MPRSLLGAGAFLFSLIVMIGIFRLCGDQLYEYPANPDLKTLPGNSAVICLAGGKHRIDTAFALFSENVGEQLVIVGAGPKSTVLSLARAHAPSAAMKIPANRWDRIAVETESRNTIENAFAVKRYLQINPHIKTVILVTSGYHMRRARFMIASQVPDDVAIVAYSPPLEVIERDNWWQSLVGIQVTAAEYLKLLMATLLIPRLGYF